MCFIEFFLLIIEFYFFFILKNITLEPPPRRLSQLSSYIPRECYYHYTVATDTKNIRKVFNDVHNMILTENLSSIGLM